MTTSNGLIQVTGQTNHDQSFNKIKLISYSNGTSPDSLWTLRDKRLVISKISLLGTLTSSEIDQVAELLNIQCYSDNVPIIRQGDLDDNVYCLLHGRALASTRDMHHKKRTFCIRQCYEEMDIVNEQALLTESSNTFTVTALGEVVCAVLNVNKFEKSVGNCADLLQRDEEYFRAQLKEIFGLTMTLSDFQRYSDRRHFDNMKEDKSHSTDWSIGRNDLIYKWKGSITW